MHSLHADLRKLHQIATSHASPWAHLVGRFPTPGFTDFFWGESIF